ncbi:CACTA en-spm transposon protein [Cucumis melo var. makuwa]|uniref:CACTA en-spm transposon protein n=1 Tax=Cucumis melo var. makuwa TaxID=1194695 RepID=A0A5D3DGD8_CUCMM|nr:CACTA en-spm transposon protein [Cucumis melo var. makuwa]
MEQATTNDNDEPRTISLFLNSLNETDVMSLEFVEDLDNPSEGTAQPSMTLTLRSRAQSRLLELERHVHANGRIPMSIVPGVEKLILPHAIRFSQTIGHFFVLDFNDQAMNRFIEHEMLITFKEFKGDYHRHFKKHSDPEEARANQPRILVERAITNQAARQKQPFNHSSRSKLFLQQQHELAE